MKKYLTTVLAISVMVILAGCADFSKNLTESAAGKNIDLSGYVMLGELESVNQETASPLGRLIMGRVSYKSRKVAIPADQKVPTAGYFRAVSTESLLGTRETIIEYDFTAGSEADAAKALEALEKKRSEAEENFSL